MSSAAPSSSGAPAAGPAVSTGQPTRTLAQLTSGWVLPFWLERLLDPSSPDHEPLSGHGDVENRSHREWTAVGTLGTERPATVDPRGLVTPRAGGWSLDWWIGGDDRWHLPSREAAVRQRIVDDAPVVETAMRVPGGDAVCRTWAFRDAAAGEVLAVEVENAGRVPVAVALAVRPYGPAGASTVSRIEVTGPEVRVDGAPAVLLPRPAARLAVSNLGGGDVAAIVMRGDAAEGSSATVACRDGFAQVALVFPLAHTARLRVLLPLTVAAPAPARRRRAPSAPFVPPNVVPPHDAVAAGWRSHAGRGLRVELPDTELGATFAAARARLLLGAGGLRLDAGGDLPARDVTAVLRALDRVGLHDEAAAVLATIGDAPGPDGRLAPTDPAADATGAVLAAIGEHWRLTHDRALAGALAAPLAAGVGAVDRARRPRGRPAASAPAGLIPSGPAGPPEVGPSVARFLDTAWGLRGLLEAATVLRGLGEDAAATAIADRAAVARAGLDAALAAAARRVGGPIPAGPDRAADGGVAASLALVAPLDLLDPASPAVDATVAAVRAGLLVGDLVRRTVGATGRSPWLTTVWARTLLRRLDPAALDAVAALVALAGPTRAWPEVVHPRRDGGVAGPGSSLVAAAGVVDTVRELLVLERRGQVGIELVLSAVVPPSWWGAGWEVHGAPTAAGPLSYAVRWHGERPALLWELDPHPGSPPVRIVAPGLDPAWAATEPRGDALLAPRTDPAPGPLAPPPAPDTSFG